MIYVVYQHIPLNETVGLAVKLIFDDNQKIKTAKKDLKKLFEFSTLGTHILFDGYYYKQINKVAMVLPQSCA